jgi:hypothetical protein
MREHVYKKGDKFTMSEAALENYGFDHDEKEYTVETRFREDHPGYDPSGGRYIYDIKELQFSLYHWEMNPA